MQKMADFTALKSDNKIPVGQLGGIAATIFGLGAIAPIETAPMPETILRPRHEPSRPRHQGSRPGH